GVVAIVLIDRNRRFLVGMQVSSPLRAAIIQALRKLPEVSKVTALRVDFVGPRRLYLVADVDLSGDDPEPRLALRLRALEARIRWPAGPRPPSTPGTRRTARVRG